MPVHFLFFVFVVSFFSSESLHPPEMIFSFPLSSYLLLFFLFFYYSFLFYAYALFNL